MKIYDKIEKLNLKSAVALGYFDGIHLGHQKVILAAVNAKKMGLIPTVFTFSKSPKFILNNKTEDKLISFEEKVLKLGKLGIEILFNLNFLDIYKLSADKFVENILYKNLNAKFISCGFNYRFGHSGTANAEKLKNLGLNYNIETKILDPVKYKNEVISSSRIRNLINIKEFQSVDDMLKI